MSPLPAAAALLVASAGIPCSAAAAPPPPVGVGSPAITLSVHAKELYDQNVFGAGLSLDQLPTYTVTDGSVAALRDHSSWVTGLSPTAAVTFKSPLNGVRELTVGYAPDLVVYHNETSETHTDHRLTLGIKGGTGPHLITGDVSVTCIDGSAWGPTFPGGFINAYNTALLRERRDQLQTRAALTWELQGSTGFIRASATLLAYDLQTHLRNIAGYQNYIDRYDANGGVDVGRKLTGNVAVTLGWRGGHQYQARLPFSPYTSSSDYQRILVGVEGTPCSWLDVKLRVGPDFRRYSGATDSRIAPLNDLRPVKFYGEARMAARFSPAGTLTLTGKEWQWVSSTGKVPYYDGSLDLLYQRRLTASTGLDLGVRRLTSDYRSGNLSTCRRVDALTTATVAVRHAFTPRLSVTLSSSFDFGRNALDGLTPAQTEQRRYNRTLHAVEFTCKLPSGRIP